MISFGFDSDILRIASQQNKPAAAPPVGAPPTGIPSIPPPSASGQLDLNALGTSSGFGAEPPATSSRYNEPYGDRREPDCMHPFSPKKNCETDTFFVDYRQRDRDERYPPPRSRYEEDRYTRDEPRDWERDRDRDYYRDRERDYERRGEPRRGPSGGGRYRERSISPPGRRQYSPGAKDYEDTMPIETQHVGMVIGRGGETLRRIERETGARIQFTPESQSRPGFRIANMVGTVSEVTAARASIKRLVEQSVAQKGSRKDGPGGNTIRQKELPPGTSKFTFTVPDKTVGLIIGRGGDSINEIQEKSGSRVNIVPASQSVNGRRPVNLFGSDEQNAKAKELIEAIVRQDEMGMKKNLAAAEESLSRPNVYSFLQTVLLIL